MIKFGCLILRGRKVITEIDTGLEVILQRKKKINEDLRCTKDWIKRIGTVSLKRGAVLQNGAFYARDSPSKHSIRKVIVIVASHRSSIWNRLETLLDVRCKSRNILRGFYSAVYQ